MTRSAPRGLKIASLALVLLPAFLGLGARPTDAYCLVGWSKWEVRTQELRVWHDINSAWNSTIWYSLAEWNYISGLHYYYPAFGVHELGRFNLRKRDFSAAGWADAPAKTVNDISNAPHTTSTVWLNTDYTFYLTGAASTHNQAQHKADLRTVLVHEFGHSAGLAHPQGCTVNPQLSQGEIDSAMHVKDPWTVKWDTKQDDWWGIEALYD